MGKSKKNNPNSPAVLILMRHGQSMWNEKNLFTGWVDVPLSEKGVQEALAAGKKIQEIPIDIIFISTLIRAQMTAFLAMLHHTSGKTPVLVHTETKQKDWQTIFDAKRKEEIIPVVSSWHLNERMYGKLQGLDKDETRKKFGKEQVQIWRRSYKTAPPNGESLEMTSQRTLPFFKKAVMHYLDQGKNVFISAHGNSLRSIIMFLDQLSEEKVMQLEIPTGIPIIYHYQDGKWLKK